MKKLMVWSVMALMLAVPKLAFAEDRLDNQIYLDAFLKNPTFFSAWQEFRKAPNLPTWLAEGGPSFVGVETPAANLEDKNGHYLGFSLCKPHSCGSTMFYVIFNVDGSKVYGYIPAGNEDKEAFLNNPDAKQKAILKKFSKMR